MLYNLLLNYTNYVKNFAFQEIKIPRYFSTSRYIYINIQLKMTKTELLFLHYHKDARLVFNLCCMLLLFLVVSQILQ